MAIVAGDWANGNTIIHSGFCGTANPRGIPVLAVLGNHDWWRLDVTEKEELQILRTQAERAGVRLLEREVYEFDSWTILGCTLWTNFELNNPAMWMWAARDAEQGMNSFERIELGRRPGGRPNMIRVANVRALHQRCWDWLDAELAARDPENCVVVTHFGPHRNSVHPIYTNEWDRKLNPYFASDTGLIEKIPAGLLDTRTHASNVRLPGGPDAGGVQSERLRRRSQCGSV